MSDDSNSGCASTTRSLVSFRGGIRKFSHFGMVEARGVIHPVGRDRDSMYAVYTILYYRRSE